MISTTKVGEFLSAMGTPAHSEKADHSHRRHAAVSADHPRGLVLYQGRHAPAGCFADAGWLSEAPAMTINCIYVPLLTAASKAADELSIASVTRGIENPKPRTCLVKIQMRSADFLAIVLFTAFLAAEIVWKAVGV